MKVNIRHLLVIGAVTMTGLFQFGCTAQAGQQAVSDGVFVHISTGPEQPHKVLMGLKMAELMSEDHDVLVYMDVNGILDVLKDSPNLKKEPFGYSHDIIKELVSRGVPVYACPGCMKSFGKTKDDLLPGVQVAEKKGFFDFTRGRILTIDY